MTHVILCYLSPNLVPIDYSPYAEARNNKKMRPLVVAMDIANVHFGLWSSSHSSVACFLVCIITNQLLLATGSASLQVWAGLVLSAWVGL